MTPVQCRMARAALQLSIIQLAQLAASNKTSIVNFERQGRCHRVTEKKLQAALESTGQIQFCGDNGVCFTQ